MSEMSFSWNLPTGWSLSTQKMQTCKVGSETWLKGSSCWHGLSISQRLMHCPSPSCWTLGHIASFVIDLLHSSQGKLDLCSSCFLCALLPRVLCSPQMETWDLTFAAVTPAADRTCAVLPQHWRGSKQIPKQLFEILTAHLMRNSLERYIWAFRGVLWFPSRTIIAVDSRINILSSHMQEWICQY